MTEKKLSDTALNAWPWPFSRGNLTAGLRRYFDDTSVRVADVRFLTMPHRRPAIGRVRGLLVDYEQSEGSGIVRLVVKEPRGTTRTGLAGAGRREVGVYQSLASQLPIRTPSFVAGSPAGEWLILEELRPSRDPSRWRSEDYERAIEGLVSLHDRFWNLAEDLNAFPWLSRPLESDFEVHVTAAAQAIERIVEHGHPEPLAGAPERMKVLARLTTSAEAIVEPLRRVPATLLHGDYWPGNIAILDDNTQVVYDWQLAGVGPGVIDLLVFVNKSAWWFGELPLTAEKLVRSYREGLDRRSGVQWSDDEWAELWDHALLWRFLQEWVDLLAASPDPLLETRAEQLDQIWLRPVAEAVERRMPA